MPYAFEKLRVWQHALDYDDLLCELAQSFPVDERFGLTRQMLRASSSIGLNVAEGSTSQSDREKARFLGYAIRSLLETVACQHITRRRGYPVPEELLSAAYQASEELFRELQAFRAAVGGRRGRGRGSRR